ncbi:Rha family transcriptional regulator [uncultured Bilophila sp.]|uniref:Rha family transcriptional regulator n=1 Tax=uncultured Bilophila sp. TaxID=529385 RepID=UPI00266F7E61|nr:Rha family transcriptional regulator [uncultured Bilophila sp.]
MIQAENGVPFATSLSIARAFGKEHKDVLRAISNLECSSGFRERNFALSSYRASSPPLFRPPLSGLYFSNSRNCFFHLSQSVPCLGLPSQRNTISESEMRHPGTSDNPEGKIQRLKGVPSPLLGIGTAVYSMPLTSTNFF